MPGDSDRAMAGEPAIGGRDPIGLQSTARLVHDLVDALVGQVQLARSHGETTGGLPRGTNRVLNELTADAKRIEEQCAVLLKALGAEQPVKPEPSHGGPRASEADQGNG